jgi:uncharacterized membrane protein
MKIYLLSYSVYTLFWPLFFGVFNEDEFNVPIALRVVLIYGILAFVLASISILVYSIVTKTMNKKHLLILGLLALNILLFITNPGNLVSDFLG